MIEYTTKYDVRKTMYQKFAESVAKRGDKPCFYYYNNTLTWNQVADLVDACANCAGSIAKRRKHKKGRPGDHLRPQYAPVHCRHLCGE